MKVANQDFYCKLEIFCFYNMKPNDFIKARHLEIEDNEYYSSITNYDVYSRNLDNYKSVVECLYEVEEMYKAEIFSLENHDASKNYCFSLFIYNE